MMGQHSRMESVFCYFRPEEQIPEDHLLRPIDRYVDLRFVRERLKNFYSPTGRPSIDPEVLLRLLLVGYLYGVSSSGWSSSRPNCRATVFCDHRRGQLIG